MTIDLPALIRIGGCLDLSVLVVAFILPAKLEFKRHLATLPPLMRQLFWSYGGYTVAAILFNGLVSVLAPNEMATTFLGQLVCAYIAIFWTTRIILQCFFHTRSYVTHWIFAVGEAALVLNFVLMATIFIIATFRLV